MKIEELKSLLISALDILKSFNDEDVIRKETNTYFLDGADYFLGISGYNGGFIDLTNIQIDEYYNDDEEEDE